MLNRCDNVTMERSVRAAGGTKPKDPGSQKPPERGPIDTLMNRAQQHAGCATILIKEGDSLRLGTPLFQILPQIAAATGCAAFLTSWKPGAATEGLAVPILHVELDQHEPEDPLHRSTARALTAIVAQFHKQGE